MTGSPSVLHDLRLTYHRRLREEVWFLNDDKHPTNADRGSKSSVDIATAMLAEATGPGTATTGQAKGGAFTVITRDFVSDAFQRLQHIRPGEWEYSTSQSAAGITRFKQFEHLAVLKEFLESLQSAEDGGKAKDLRAAFASDYLITPDIVVARRPVSDTLINATEVVIADDDHLALHSPLRARNNEVLLMHASISCKWTLRSDRAQNARTEALNLIRNRKGNAPHIVVVTGEPLASRLASLCLGTGDIDCVYHMALYELQEAIEKHGNDSEQEMLDTLVRGHRLRDISDLVFDLAI